MIWLIGALAFVILVLAACLLRSRDPEPLDPEATMKAAVELHRIRRDLDVSYTKSEQRRDASLVEHRIVEIIDGGNES